jgi:tetratricopeptide (TPR) repeat protein
MGVRAQKVRSYEEVDSITYENLLTKDYKALKKNGTAALKQGVDFCFLRMRMGISFYEQEKYEQALTHFRKAYIMNPADSVVTEYLYYCLIFTQRMDEARMFARKQTDQFRKKINYVEKQSSDIAGSFEKIGVFAGALINNPKPGNERKLIQEAIYSEKTIQKNNYFASVYFENIIKKRLHLYNSMSYFRIQSLGTIKSDSLSSAETKNGNNVWTYTLGVMYTIKNSIQLGGFVNYNRESSDYLMVVYDENSYKLFNKNIVYNANTYSVGLNASFRIKNWGLGVAVGAGNLSGGNQYLCEGTVLWYPLGNTKLYTVTTLSYLNNNKQNQYIINQTVGGRLTKRIWGEINAGYGNHQNYFSGNGLKVFNTAEPVMFNSSVDLRFIFGKMALIPSYGYQIRESSRYLYYPEDYKVVKKNYSNHIIKLAAIWNF